MSLAETGILTDEELQRIYIWVDSIPLSRPKRNIARDFSDGVLLAEIVHHYFPKYVELHNYSSANSIRQKLYNWSTLNQKVLKRLDFEVKKSDVEAIVNCKPGVIELVLMQLQQKITDLRARKAAGEASPTSAPAPPSASHAAFAAAAGGAGAPALAAAPVARALHMSGVGGAGAAEHVAPVAPPAALAAGRPLAAGAGGGGEFMYAGMGGMAGMGGGGGSGGAADAAVLAEKDATIAELRETIEIQELKIRKLEQLVKLKDQRITTLTARLQAVPGGAGPAPGIGMGMPPA